MSYIFDIKSTGLPSLHNTKCTDVLQLSELVHACQSQSQEMSYNDYLIYTCCALQFTSQTIN